MPTFPDYEDIFEKPCYAFPHKKRYGTENAAAGMIARRLGEARLRSYHCKSCLGWAPFIRSSRRGETLVINRALSLISKR